MFNGPAIKTMQKDIEVHRIPVAREAQKYRAAAQQQKRKTDARAAIEAMRTERIVDDEKRRAKEAAKVTTKARRAVALKEQRIARRKKARSDKRAKKLSAEAQLAPNKMVVSSPEIRQQASPAKASSDKRKALLSPVRTRRTPKAKARPESDRIVNQLKGFADQHVGGSPLDTVKQNVSVSPAPRRRTPAFEHASSMMEDPYSVGAELLLASLRSPSSLEEITRPAAGASPYRAGPRRRPPAGGGSGQKTKRKAKKTKKVGGQFLPSI